MPDQVYRYPVVRPADPTELREARRERFRLAALSGSPHAVTAAVARATDGPAGR